MPDFKKTVEEEKKSHLLTKQISMSPSKLLFRDNIEALESFKSTMLATDAEETLLSAKFSPTILTILDKNEWKEK